MAPPLKFNPRFDDYFDRLIGSEGGYSKSPDDPGNWTGGVKGCGKLLGTKFGIAANTYPDLDIAGLTLDQAKAIYRRDWWDAIHADYLAPAISYQLWDFAINAGMPRAVMSLQRAVDVLDDGVLGELTMSALSKCDVNDVVYLLTAERIEFLTRRRNWPQAGAGWMNRIARNLRFAAQDN
jgi:lysozyme family protein